jgi:hypothetical protein
MLIGCLLPILLIFLLPSFGVSEGVGVWLFLILMFGCHLMMMRGGHHGHDQSKKNH